MPKKVILKTKCADCSGTGEESVVAADERVLVVPCSSCNGTKFVTQELFAEEVTVEDVSQEEIPVPASAPQVCDVCGGSKEVTVNTKDGYKTIACPKCM